MKQKFILLIIIICILLSACSVEKPPYIPELTNISTEHKTIDSMQNLYGSGRICGTGDWLFYVDKKKGQICRVKKDGTELAVLRDYGGNDVEELQISGSWLYYFEYGSDSDDYIRRMDLNGEIIEELDLINQTEFWAVDENNIYLIRGGGYFARISYDHNKNPLPNSLNFATLNDNAFIYDGLLYYTSKEGVNTNIIRRNLNDIKDSKKICAIDEDAKKIIIRGEYIYYLVDDNFYRMPIKSDNNAQLLGNGWNGIVLNNGGVLLTSYYSLQYILPDKGIKKTILKSDVQDYGFIPHIIDGEIYILIDDPQSNILTDDCTLQQVSGPLYRLTLAEQS